MRMIVGLDHLIVLTRDLDAAIAGYRALLGCEPSWRSTADGIANATFTLSNVALELVSPIGAGAAAEQCSMPRARDWPACVFASAMPIRCTGG